MTDQDKTALLSKLRAPVADEPPGGTRWPVLRAMARNYTAGKHTWDALDADACEQAAEEIRHLRAALASAPVVGEAVATVMTCYGGEGRFYLDAICEKGFKPPPGTKLYAAPPASDAVRNALIAASNYIDTLGGDSKPYRVTLASAPVVDGRAVFKQWDRLFTQYCGAEPGKEAGDAAKALEDFTRAALASAGAQTEYERGRADGWAAGWDEGVAQDARAVPVADERATFEAAYKRRQGTPVNLELLRDGNRYTDGVDGAHNLNVAWESWQDARAALSAQPGAQRTGGGDAG